jgi:hypothetical protein
MRFPFLRHGLVLAALALLSLAPAAVAAPARAATNLRLAPAVGTVGARATLYAYLTRDDNKLGLSGQEITFRVAGATLTDETETSIGVAHVEFYVENLRPGTYRVLAQFKGDPYFTRSAATSTLTIAKGSCVFPLQMTPRDAPLNQPYTLGAILVNKSGQGIKGRRIKVEIDNRLWRTLITDAAGAVTSPYTFQQPGPHTVRFSFDGDGFFNPPNPLNLRIQVK